MSRVRGPECRPADVEALRRASLRMAATAAALGIALVAAACGGSEPESNPTAATGSWEDVVAAAEKEGKVTI